MATFGRYWTQLNYGGKCNYNSLKSTFESILFCHNIYSAIFSETMINRLFLHNEIYNFLPIFILDTEWVSHVCRR